MHSGTLTLEIVLPSPETDTEPPSSELGNGQRPIGGEHKPHIPYIIELHKRSGTGGFGVSSWRKFGLPFAATDITHAFYQVWRNDDNTMLEHLDIYKDNAVLFGHITKSAHVNYPLDAPMTYCQFLTHPWWTRGGDPDDDGDLDFALQVEKDKLEWQRPSFWDEQGWLRSRDDIKNKLEDQGAYKVGVEAIMYGRTIDEANCAEDTLPLLPGWMESGANSVLLNGWPIDGQVDWGSSAWILGRQLLEGSGNRVRVTGVLSLDKHQGTSPSEHNVEIHPVYAIDILQNFHLPRPTANLTGVWAATDAGTYYVRQIGNDVWWLGLSRDQGLTFTNVFHGILQDNLITGQWADVPMGGRAQNSGSLSILNNGQGLTSTSLVSMDTGVFQGYQWEKLYDYDHKFILITFEYATASDPSFGWSDDTFKVYVNGVRHEISPSNIQTFPQRSRAELRFSTLLELPTNAFLSLLVESGGYQLYRGYENMTDFGEGDHTEGLSWIGNSNSPTQSDSPNQNRGFPRHVGGKDSEDAQRRPSLAITYRITRVPNPAEIEGTSDNTR
jgi:hypothetical protein